MKVRLATFVAKPGSLQHLPHTHFGEPFETRRHLSKCMQRPSRLRQAERLGRLSNVPLNLRCIRACLSTSPRSDDQPTYPFATKSPLPVVDASDANSQKVGYLASRLPPSQIPKRRGFDANVGSFALPHQSPQFFHILLVNLKHGFPPGTMLRQFNQLCYIISLTP